MAGFIHALSPFSTHHTRTTRSRHFLMMRARAAMPKPIAGFIMIFLSTTQVLRLGEWQ
jgi:hypothetical protein